MKWEDLVDILTQQAVLITDDEQVLEKYLQVGELWETRLQSPDRAIHAYREVLHLDEKNLEALRALGNLYQQQDNWVEVLDIYEQMLNTMDSVEDKAAVYHRLAAVQLEHLHDPEGSIDTYRRILGIQPGDAQAVEAVEALLRDGERWDELTDVYRLHLDAVDDVEYARTVRTIIADIYRGPLQDASQAVEALTPILETEPEHVDTLFTLGELFAELGRWEECIDALRQEAALLENPETQVARYHQMGTISQANLGDSDAAEMWFRRGLDIDKTHGPTLDSLKTLHSDRVGVVRSRKIATNHRSGLTKLEGKSRALAEIARIYDAHLDEKSSAIDYAEQAMDLWPENIEAAQFLIDVYWQDNNFVRAEPLLDLLIEQGGREPTIEHGLHYQLAVVAENLQKHDKALRHYRKAYEIDSTHLDTLQGMGRLLIERDDWDRAFKIFQTVLVHHRDALGETGAATIFHQQGHIKLQVGEKRKALDFFRKALDIDPNHIQSLRSVAAIHEGRGDWEDVVHYRRRLVDCLEDTTEKFQLQLEIGEVLGQRLNHNRAALELYQSLLEKESLKQARPWEIAGIT